MSSEQMARRAEVHATGITDADLVTKARAGDGRALDALYRRHAPVMGGLAARLLGSRQDVDDIVHDVFVAAFDQLDRLREPAAFRAWVIQITVTKVRQALRRHRVKAAIGLAYQVPDATLEALASADVSPERRAELALLDRALSELPADARLAWMLRHVEGHPVQDVAQQCGCSESTAKRRIEVAGRTVERFVRSRGWRS